MAKVVKIGKKSKGEAVERIRKSLESGHINCFLGSGASMPAIPLAKGIEEEIDSLLKDGDDKGATEKRQDFLKEQLCANKAILDISQGDENSGDLNDCEQRDNIKETLQEYVSFIKVIDECLSKRSSTLLPKRANVFTTNYDIFLEKASEGFSNINFNDGFRRGITLDQEYKLDTSVFYNTLSNSNNLYTYTVQIPTINLIKIHGSLTWKKPSEGEGIVFRNMESDFPKNDSEDLALILPQKDKHKETMLNAVHYDLLRIYANELDKENTVLIVFGFSFSDEHIMSITKRALKNTTLQLLIFAHTKKESKGLRKAFESFRNVLIFFPQRGAKTNLSKVNSTLQSIFDEEESG